MTLGWTTRALVTGVGDVACTWSWGKAGKGYGGGYETGVGADCLVGVTGYLWGGERLLFGRGGS